ncbi:class I SAM-dependent methyltransferase [Pontixanthobacter aestiaquae]|uniref:Methyltransferase domain-containing protein n=1 Tax=Pontixanthobacter aestiaquae TaxID=1509367 RepID=A0A844Z916_9SPHN|nr:class I SAM-dependent methyltransferase [Pontixanthobacter aestiaquae]MDN3645292.1 class I SAM-dependent methyltransferase [Pontixanthobacter aestiaquae]MXO83706.1 methyltransferase domain-containing protein [Pontixanthobacter aestiaquae]
MGIAKWWDEHGVPRVIKVACGAPQIMKLRSQLVPLAQGDVFEIGCGGGINQQFYNAGAISRYAGIDPGAKLLEYTKAEAQKKGWKADIRDGVGEAIPFDDASFDTVVCTYTMCSVQDQAQVVREMRRILKPGGRLLYLEHGRAPDASVAKWQDRIEPIWKPIAGGCHLTRPITTAVRDGGFEVEQLGERYAPKTPRPVGWMEWGVGVKVGA